jgi:hypothetical protein
LPLSINLGVYLFLSSLNHEQKRGSLLKDMTVFLKIKIPYLLSPSPLLANANSKTKSKATLEFST